MLNAGLAEVDPELYDIIEHEKNRQYKGLELIPSENFVSASVMEAVRACLPALPCLPVSASVMEAMRACLPACLPGFTAHLHDLGWLGCLPAKTCV